jgi:hypothetical protein
VRLYSRAGNEFTHRFPLIVETLVRLRSRSCIIDGEAVVCDDNDIAAPREGGDGGLKSSKSSNAIYCASFANFAPRSQDASRDGENAETGDAEQRRAREFQAAIKLLYPEDGDWPKQTHDIYRQRGCPRDPELKREARDGDDCEGRKREKRHCCERWSRRRLPYCRLDGSRHRHQ